MARILLLSSQPILGGDIIKSLLTKGDADLAKIDVVTNSASLGKGAMGTERYLAVFAFAEDQSTHSHTFLADIQKSLAPGGAVTIVEKDHLDTQLLEKKLVMAGFMDCRTEVSPSGDAMIEARKPTWSQAASRPIKLQSGSLQPPSSNGIQSGSSKELNGNGNGNATANHAQTQNAWSLAADNLEDDDIVDEDDLLLDEDKIRPEAYDCGINTTKKACKDCTCGRAEGEKVEVKLTQDMLDNPQSSGCGSCGLGDAFRCGTCPYRGLPSFEMGKKIELPPDFLAVDI